MSVKRINRRLNLVVELESDEGRPLYVHSTPFRREVFDANFLVLGKVFTAIYKEGLGAVSGPRVAGNLLRSIAAELKITEQVEKELIAEIHRLTLVLAPSDKGWEMIPYHEAKQRGILSEDDAAEVDNALVFFTVGSWMYRRSETESLEGAFDLWGARLESSSSTEFRNSLPIWTPPVSSGETPTT